jgi:hypothetical protein
MESEVYFSGGINDRSEKGFYWKGILFFEGTLKCPVCHKSFPSCDLRNRVAKAEFMDGTSKNVNYCMCPWGHEVCVGTDIRVYKDMDFGYME